MSDEMNRCVWPLGECTKQDRIEELEAKELANKAAIMRLEAKLAKALSALEVGIAKHDGAEKFLKDARTTLAELTGGTDE